MPDSGLDQPTVDAADARKAGNGASRSVLPESLGPRAVSQRGIEAPQELAERFVFPLNHSVAHEKLTGDARTVLLAGRPGMGRRSAALMLLRSVDDPDGAGGPDRAVTELLTPRGTVEKLEPRTIESGSRLLLDLSHVRESPSPDALGELAAFLPVVRQRDAWLVVVLPDGHQPWWHGLSGLVVELQRPRPRTVLRRNLAAEGVATDSGGQAPGLPVWLHTAPMRDIAELARLQASIQAPGTQRSVGSGQTNLRWSLLAEARVRRQLAAAWRSTLGVDPGRATRTRVWLQAALTAPEPEDLLAVLVDATDERMDRLGLLHVVARDWACADEARCRVRDALATRIDAAQEIHPADFELGPQPEESS